MKIRNGFVSNSSSSSFVVALSKSASKYDLGEFISEFEVSSNEIKYAEHLLNELQCQDNEEVDLSDIYVDIDIYANALSDNTKEQIQNKYIDLIEKVVKREIKKEKKTNKYYVSYSDNDGEFFSYMEHDFMPYFEGTIRAENCH